LSEIDREIAKELRRNSEEKLSRVVYLQKPKEKTIDIFGRMEERVTRTVPLDKLERLYRIDWLVFRIVNKYIEKIVTNIILEGEEQIVKELKEWMEEVGLKFIIEENVRDIFLGGNAWTELGYTRDGLDIVKLQIVNPKTIDYIRDDRGIVEVDKTGEFVGYKRLGEFIYEEIEYRKENIKVGGKIVWKRTREEEDGRDRIAHLKLWGLGESYLGLTPLEPCYLNSIIRLNISKSTGEGAFRSGGIIAYVGTENRPATNEQIDQLAEDLRNIETETIFVFKHNVKIERFPSPDLKDREALLYYYANTTTGGMGIPFSLILEPGTRGYRGDMELKLLDFETTIRSLQERLAYQIREKYFRRLMKARNLDLTKVPRVVFKTYMPTVQRDRFRNIAALFRRGVVKYDPKIAKRVLEELDLPTNLPDKELQEEMK